MCIHRCAVILAGMLALVVGSAGASDLEKREAAAREAAMTLMKELGGELKRAMRSGGPQEAIAVCTERAPAITARISRERGWKVTRVSSRYRNPLLGMPDAWEAETLEVFRQRHADGEPYKGMSRAERVSVNGRADFRYMQAIPMQGLCMSCHGPKEALAPEVRERLEERYPHDRAIGFSVGDLRGAFSIRQSME